MLDDLQLYSWSSDDGHFGATHTEKNSQGNIETHTPEKSKKQKQKTKTGNLEINTADKLNDTSFAVSSDERDR